eukprot:TRINITY_DN8783_c0_g1_i1.p1 TRINITY_DN8783_c0_g1~~TRINITY_DN8783_c0_g1_i1.p1  ORF type:complete len:109 (+),score=40.49 TRINITY_DN8783_c0_g1_i1:453-779(+)
MADGKEELACTYAALVLHDAGLPVTATAMGTLMKAANITVQPFWPALFARVLASRNIDEVILSGGAAAASAPAAVAAAAPVAAAKQEDKAPAKKEEEPEEEVSFSLFD